MNTNKQTGLEYEKAAALLLKKNGYKIIEKNYSSRFGEIDIIASKKEFIVFVEVKYRKNINYGHAAEFVNKNKQNKIIKTALEYIKKHTLSGKCFRFDVVAINDTDTEIIENAYTLSEGNYYL